jgi:hypothetical protein
MLQPNTWTRVPGTFEVDIYPIIHKPSITCSSTFVLRSPENIVIIDPGGDKSQLEQIRDVIGKFHLAIQVSSYYHIRNTINKSRIINTYYF